MSIRRKIMANNINPLDPVSWIVKAIKNDDNIEDNFCEALYEGNDNDDQT